MSEKNIDNLFERLQHDFDVEEPNANHNKRFLEKLNNHNNLQIDNAIQKINWWKPLMGIAASIALIITLFIGLQNDTSSKDLASVSPEMAETENFFTSTIALELSEIEKESSPETQLLIKDTMIQMQTLEEQYELLKEDLKESGDDKRVIYAMISNFQKRIDLLQNTLKYINNIKQLKNENSYTI